MYDKIRLPLTLMIFLFLNLLGLIRVAQLILFYSSDPVLSKKERKQKALFVTASSAGNGQLLHSVIYHVFSLYQTDISLLKATCPAWCVCVYQIWDDLNGWAWDVINHNKSAFHWTCWAWFCQLEPWAYSMLFFRSSPVKKEEEEGLWQR